MKKSYLWTVFLISLIILFFCIYGAAKATSSKSLALSLYGFNLPEPQNITNLKEPGKFYLVTLDRLTLNDIKENFDVFKPVLDKGALGLMSTGVDGALTPDSTFASIGAGAPINATGAGTAGMNADEKYNGGTAAGVTFYQRTGIEAPPGSVLQLDIARIKKINAQNSYSAIPGSLGTLLGEGGLPTQVFGNSDFQGYLRRPSVGLAMNADGFVPGGNVSSEMLTIDDVFPGGLRTNYSKLVNLLEQQQNKGLYVIELGDLDRLEKARADVDESVLKTKRKESITAALSFIKDLMGLMNIDRDLMLIVSPTPRGINPTSTNYLTPVIAVGNGVTKGILTSPTTKRPGIIKNTDLAPSVLHYFSIKASPQMFGRDMQFISSENSLEILSSLYRELEMISEARSPVLRNYVLIQLILVLLSLAAIFLPKNQTLLVVLKPLLLALMSIPLALLITALLPYNSLAVMVTEIICITVAIITAIHMWLKKYSNDLDPFIIISILTSAFIVMDIILGSPLQKNSLLGYDPIVGARFYGLGNEYMGVLLGSTIIGSTALLNRFIKHSNILLFIVGVYYLTTLFVIGAPHLGTNVGGAIAAAGSLLVTFLLLKGVSFHLKTIIKVAAAIIAVLASLIIYDLSRPIESQSHMGRAAGQILQGGLVEIFNIIKRKMAMNIKLLRYTIWSKIFIASLASLAILFYRPIGVMQLIKFRYPILYKGFIGVVTASIIALFFNDSGVVAAATAMIFGAPPLLYLAIRTLRIKG